MLLSVVTLTFSLLWMDVIRSEGIVLEWVKITAVGLGLLLVAWRIVKNTQLWRNLSLIVLGGECLAADEAGLAPDGLLDNLPNTGGETLCLTFLSISVIFEMPPVHVDSLSICGCIRDGPSRSISV